MECVETGETFPSIAKAALSTGTDTSAISGCCLGKRQTAKGLHWRYIDQRQNTKPKSKESVSTISVRRRKDGLWGVLCNGILLRVFRTREYAEAYASDSALKDKDMEKLASKESPLSQRVRHLETGKIYPSIRQASRHLKIAPSSICRVLNGQRETVKGQHFERVE